MKNIFSLFLLAFLLVFVNVDSNAVPAQEDGGTVFVVIAKTGQPLLSVELPTIGSKAEAAIKVKVIDNLTGQIVFAGIAKNSQLDLPALKSGDYMIEINLLGYTHQQSIIL